MTKIIDSLGQVKGWLRALANPKFLCTTDESVRSEVLAADPNDEDAEDDTQEPAESNVPPVVTVIGYTAYTTTETAN